MRILFMGTPDFARISLSALCERDTADTVIGVVTNPDKPQGRGYKLTPSPVKVYAEARQIPVFQPRTLRDGGFDATLAELDPDLIVVVAYGKILPGSVIHYPAHGCVNVHGSLLPALRGAAPMQRAVMEGLPQTGITTMLMDEGLDTGDMLLKSVVAIEPDDTFEQVHDKLAAAGADTLLKTVDAIREGTLKPVPQDGANSTYAAKITKDDCLVDFSKAVSEIHNQIRGLSPAPLAFTRTPDSKLLKIARARICRSDGYTGKPGTVLSLSTDRDGGIEVACGTGSILLTEVVPEGKGRMRAPDYIRGRRLAVGDCLGDNHDKT